MKDTCLFTLYTNNPPRADLLVTQASSNVCYSCLVVGSFERALSNSGEEVVMYAKFSRTLGLLERTWNVLGCT